MITVGIDVGSTTIKAVLWVGDRMGPCVITTEMYLKRKNRALEVLVRPSEERGIE